MWFSIGSPFSVISGVVLRRLGGFTRNFRSFFRDVNVRGCFVYIHVTAVRWNHNPFLTAH